MIENYLKIIFIGCIISFNNVLAQSSTTNNNALTAKFDEVAAAFFKKDGLGGVMLVAQHGKVVYEKSAGKASMELNVPLTTQHVFRIGSITKQFTAVAILQLIEKGMLKLDDDITKFIPDYPTHDNHISVAHLLSHTSGIKNITEIENLPADVRRKNNTPIELISLFKDLPMDFTPGTNFKYSNSNYILLGHIIEKLSGKSYEQYLTDNIFTPLSMNHSFYDSPEKVILGRISGYVDIGNNKAVNADYLNASCAYAAGALMMTADDLYKWHKGLYEYKILKKETLAQAFTSFTLSDGKKTKYGYGWELDSLSDSPAIQHGGSINGFSAFEIYLPLEDIYVVCFSNCINKNTKAPAVIAAALITQKPIAKEIALSEKQMNNYIGIYKFQLDKPNTLNIFKKNGKLFLQDSRSPHPWKMHFTKPTEFYCYELFPNNHIFSIDSVGKVTGFTIRAETYTSKITKIE